MIEKRSREIGSILGGSLVHRFVRLAFPALLTVAALVCLLLSVGADCIGPS
jgi:hypothetical protein